MKAIVRDRYRSPDVLELGEIEKAALKDDGEAGRRYQLSRVPEAIEHLAGLHAPGKVVVTV